MFVSQYFFDVENSGKPQNILSDIDGKWKMILCESEHTQKEEKK
jgi:hypothetical protein